MGVKHWIFQRACNLVFVLFGAWLLISLLTGGLNSFEAANGLLTGSMGVVLAVVLILAALNSILAGWQIAGDYASKIGVSEGLMTGIGAAVSVAYLVIGLGLIF